MRQKEGRARLLVKEAVLSQSERKGCVRLAREVCRGIFWIPFWGEGWKRQAQDLGCQGPSAVCTAHGHALQTGRQHLCAGCPWAALQLL